MEIGDWAVALDLIDDGEQVPVEPGECGTVVDMDDEYYLVLFDLRGSPFLIETEAGVIREMEYAIYDE